LKGNNLTSRTHILSQNLVSKGRNAYGAILRTGAHPIGEAQQGAHHTLGRFFEGEALQPSLVIQTALDEHLHQSYAEFRLPLGLFLDFRGGPGHEGNVIQGGSAFRVLEVANERALAQEIVGAENVNDGFGTV